MRFSSDHANSDGSDMEAILEYSMSFQGAADSSGSHGLTKKDEMPVGDKPNYAVRQELNGRLAGLDTELKEVDEQMEKLKQLRSKILDERQAVLNSLNADEGNRNSARTSLSPGKTKAKITIETIDYMKGTFEWSGELKARMRDAFGIQNFRLCQEGVCNANMDGRDIVCVMPTGGGKSLTYQLPALLNPGCTLVISPLISLITDQILHLREFGVEAVKLTGSTTKEESRSIFSRLALASGVKSRGSYNDVPAGPEIKLCYVTPEKIAKSKTFTSMLEKLVNAGKLARIVIDEAHCVSQLGHDFRPDYKKLSILRQLFPRVPILALSATCPPKVLKDLIFTLRLKPVVTGTAASGDGTVYFSAPLYRKNLHYQVLPKPSSAGAVIKVMAEYILKYHKDDSGIVYCLSKKDTETVAQGLSDESGGEIRTGVYHADVHDREKEGLHRRWRNGDVKVVCATIAFGLGIDKGDVRFVLHHSVNVGEIALQIQTVIPCRILPPIIFVNKKSLEGYYQESGRAGRDGKDSDCILYHRPHDSTRLSALVCGEIEGQDKLQDMVRFAQDVEECRKLQFSRYFSAASSLSMSAWGTAESDAHARCGHCDNCTRPPETVERRDVTLAAWQVLQIAEAIERDRGRVTLGMLADLVRGAGGGAFGVSGGGGKRGKGKAKEKVGLDLDEIAGGKVALGKDETEILLVNLLLSQHLKESFHSTAYAINVYVLTGPSAIRLSRYSREDVEAGKGPRIIVAFLKKKSKKRGSSKEGARGSGGRNKENDTGEDFFNRTNGKKRKRYEGLEADPEFGDDSIADDENVMSLYIDDDEPEEPRRRADKGRKRLQTKVLSEDEGEEEDDWEFTFDGGSVPKTKPRNNPRPRGRGGSGHSSGLDGRAPLAKAQIPAGDSVIEIVSESE
ncbi:hypothetical protein M0805_002791 [Coniferiporia weirii]|nr:hypothetical protein M0805_002791 [Coniferiporia weirii]